MNFQYNLLVIFMVKLIPILKNHQKLIKILSFLFILSFIISIFLYQKLKNEAILQEYQNLANYLEINHINYLIYHFIILSLVISSLILGIGFILFPFYFMFEIISLNYNLFTLINLFKFKGFIFSLFYNILTKLIYLILIIYIFQKNLNILKIFISNSTKYDSLTKNTLIITNLKKIIISSFFIILNDIFIYFFGAKILLSIFNIIF